MTPSEHPKVLYFDVETTGLNPLVHDIIQLSGIIEIAGEVKETFNLHGRPKDISTVTTEALAVTGFTLTEVMTFPTQYEMYEKFIDILMMHVDKYDKQDKFYPAGYNVRFDLDFLSALFKKMDDPYLGSFINWKIIDPFPVLTFMDHFGYVKLPNYQLSTVCGNFLIPLKAHDALADITATRELVQRLSKQFKPLPIPVNNK